MTQPDPHQYGHNPSTGSWQAAPGATPTVMETSAMGMPQQPPQGSSSSPFPPPSQPPQSQSPQSAPLSQPFAAAPGYPQQPGQPQQAGQPQQLGQGGPPSNRGGGPKWLVLAVVLALLAGLLGGIGGALLLRDSSSGQSSLGAATGGRATEQPPAEPGSVCKRWPLECCLRWSQSG